MKKTLLYILLFTVGIILGFVFFTKNSNYSEKNYLAVDKPVKYEQKSFSYSALSMLGREIIVNGKIQEAYKNKDHELVLYILVENIPVTVSCTLKNTDKQIKTPIKLGETISIQGKFMRLDERMELKKCLLLQRK